MLAFCFICVGGMFIVSVIGGNHHHNHHLPWASNSSQQFNIFVFRTMPQQINFADVFIAEIYHNYMQLLCTFHLGIAWKLNGIIWRSVNTSGNLQIRDIGTSGI